MKRVVPFIIFIMILFSSCANKSKIEGKDSESWRIVSQYNLTEKNKNGMFLITNEERLDFIDFSTMQQSPVCDKPACKHTENESCSAFGKSNHPFIYDEKLCYFKETEMYLENDIYKKDVQLWQCDINGRNEKQLAEFKGLNYETAGRMIINGTKIYMCMTCQTFDKDFKEMEPSIKIVSYDFSSNKTDDYGEIVSGYSSGTWVYGVWNNKIILFCSRAKINMPYMQRIEKYAKENNLSDEKAISEFKDEYENSYFEFDLSSKSIKECKTPEPLAISENYYFYNDGSDLMYFSSDGKENKIKDISNVENVDPMNSYAVIYTDEEIYLFNYENRDIVKLSLEKGQSVCAISGKDIIIKTVNYGGQVCYDKESISSMEATS